MIAAPFVARALQGQRRFDLYRDGDLIGAHTLTASKTGDTVTMAIEIDIRVKFLGFTAYLYEHENRETWVGGRLQALNSRTNDDGDPATCAVERRGDQLFINGQPAPDGAPTSYWNVRTLQQQPWFSSQTGKILDLNFRSAQSGAQTRVDVTGSFETTLFYDQSGEWRGCQFDGSGELITYREVAPGPAFMDFLT